jgi:hypothetical protein
MQVALHEMLCCAFEQPTLLTHHKLYDPHKLECHVFGARGSSWLHGAH